MVGLGLKLKAQSYLCDIGLRRSHTFVENNKPFYNVFARPEVEFGDMQSLVGSF